MKFYYKQIFSLTFLYRYFIEKRGISELKSKFDGRYVATNIMSGILKYNINM